MIDIFGLMENLGFRGPLIDALGTACWLMSINAFFIIAVFWMPFNLGRTWLEFGWFMNSTSPSDELHDASSNHDDLFTVFWICLPVILLGYSVIFFGILILNVASQYDILPSTTLTSYRLAIRLHTQRTLSLAFLSFKIVVLCAIELLAFPILCGVVCSELRMASTILTGRR
jgi:hypothetical protein